MNDVWVETRVSLHKVQVEPMDVRVSSRQPASWTCLDATEFRTIHKFVPVLFDIVEQENETTVIFIGEGCGDNMTTWYESGTKRKVDEGSSLAIFFFTAHTLSGRVYEREQLKKWNLPVVSLITSPSSVTSGP